MISSFVWLYMVIKNIINSDNAPWVIYIPVVTFECILYFYLLIKTCDYFDNRKLKA